MAKRVNTSSGGRLVPAEATVLIGLLALLGCGGSYELWQLPETRHIWNIFHLSRWVMEMWLIALSTILIIVLSAAITYMHGVRSQESASNGLARKVTMLIGIVILITTSIKDAFIRVNFWDLSYAIEDVEEILDNFDLRWQRYDLSIPAIRGEFTINVINTKDKVRGVRDRLRKKSPATTSGGVAPPPSELMITLSWATMLAARGYPQRDSTFVPQWYASPPENASAALITGRASAPGLGDAQSQAAATALEMFTQVIRQSLSLKFGDRQTNQGQAIPSFVAESIKKGLQPYWEKHILNDDFIYNAQDNTFTVFVLVQIDHGLAQDIYDAFVAPSLGNTMADDVWVQVKEIMSRDVRLTATDLRQRRAGDGIRSHEAGRFAAGYSAFEAGQQQLQSRHYKEAAANLRAVVDANPDFYLANFNLAKAYELLGDKEQAGSFYQRAVNLEQSLPTALRDASLYYHLGRHYEQRKDSEKALANYNRALDIDPEQAYALQARYYLLRHRAK